MRLLDAVRGKVCAYVLDHCNRPGNADDVAKALEAYGGPIQNGASSVGGKGIIRNEGVHQFGQNGAGRVS